jgi:hypothetical protein
MFNYLSPTYKVINKTFYIVYNRQNKVILRLVSREDIKSLVTLSNEKPNSSHSNSKLNF